MASDERLDERVRSAPGQRCDVREVRTLGGVCLTVAGHLGCGQTGKKEP